MVYPNVKDKVTVPNGTPDKTLFVCVDETYGKGLCDPPKSGRRVSLEDCARGYWTEANLSASHGYDCEWLMARAKSKIVGVWRIDRKQGWMVPSATPKATWPSDKPTPLPRRRGCVLIPVDEETRKRFLNKEVHLGRNPNTLRGYFV
ncbi:MAG: hypothetical protein IKF72_04715 [Kiritimatiellae bacterium]|nr:hypothetical protein [Kiritimatiellia bacterium]